MALLNACNVSLNTVNTGTECDASMDATAMLIMVPVGASWTDADITGAGSFTEFAKTKIHAAGSSRWFPIGGYAAPINSITESNEADVTETLDDGSTIFVRYGKYNRTFSTTKGGLCLADKLMRFPKGYSFVEVDISGKVLQYKVSEGTYKGVPVTLFKGLAPEAANLKTSYKNKFMLSFDPVAYVQNGVISATDSDEDVLGLQGLLDVEVTAGTATQTTTNIFFGVKTECAETDLVELYTGTGAGKIGQITNFIVTKVSDGTVVTPSAVAVVNGEVRLTGTYTSGADYYVAMNVPATLKTNGISGYEGVKKATISIP